MEKNIKIAVLGGTGKAGKYVVSTLLQQGYSVKMLHRNPENPGVIDSHIEIVKGDARDPNAVSLLAEGAQVVISALGQPVGERSIFSEATINILAAMRLHGIKRYIVLTGLNVDVPGDQKTGATKSGTEWMKTQYPKTTADKQVEFGILTNCDAEWTLVRLPLIEQTGEIRKISIGLEDCPGEKISASDLAQFVVAQIEDRSYIRQSPFISS